MVTVTSITDEGAAWFCTERSCLLPDSSSYWAVETLQPESCILQSLKVAAGTEHFTCSFTDLRTCFESSALLVLLRDVYWGFCWVLPLVSVLGGACCHELHAVLIKLHTSLIKLQS